MTSRAPGALSASACQSALQGYRRALQAFPVVCSHDNYVCTFIAARSSGKTVCSARPNSRGRPAVIVYLWNACGPTRTARGVTDSEARSRQAAETLLIGGQATDAVLEKAFLGLG